ncbi:MAG: OsmC family protein [Candidatus Omnitrophica bacterium]|jgi:uncharacterized OsmC-like protein|nr:OsmC family protein [Candidatus Omnitrophota bacterium]
MYRVQITNAGSNTFDVKSHNHEFLVDMQGISGITPADALLVSLGTCLGAYLHKYAQGSPDTGIDAFSINVEADFDKESPVCFRKIYISIDLKGVKLDPRRMKAMVDFIKNCPVHNTLKSNPELEIRVS